MKAEDKIKVTREAGYVERCHTIPHIGSYSIAQHCYGTVNLLLLLHPDPSIDLIKAVLWHDVHERYIGDVPSPALNSDGEFARLYQRLGERVDKVCGIHIKLNKMERVWLRAVDKIDLLLWAKEQMMAGNQNAAVICGNLANWFQNNNIPVQCKGIVETYDMVRRPDELPK